MSHGSPTSGGGHTDRLPNEALLAVAHVVSNYTVLRGAGGVVRLCRRIDDTWKVWTPDERAFEFRGWLQDDMRLAVLRALRQHPAVQQLEELKVTPLRAEGVVVDQFRVAHHEQGWYWVVGDEQTLICRRSEAVRVSLQTLTQRCIHLAVNNSAGAWHDLLGVANGHEWLHPRARTNSNFEVLVVCPYPASRELQLLVRTEKGPAFVGLTVGRSAAGKLEVPLRLWDAPRPYFVATDAKGKVRVFHLPE